MELSLMTLALGGIGAAALTSAAAKAKTRLELSRAKHPSLTGHVRMSRRVASLIPHYEFGDERFFNSDDAPGDVAARRRQAFHGLAEDYKARYPRTIALKAEVKGALSDMQFTDTYRVPFPFSRMVREHLGAGPFLEASSGVTLTDVDGNLYYDLAGSYGVNVFGYDFYKQCLEEGAARVGALGPVLGLYHPVIAENIARIKEISGLDEVSFHMSGTEAVMQAVRLARYHTGRSHLVRFSGAYHGWWGDVQPGVGNPERARSTYTLAEMSEATLKVLRRRRDIACVLVNPIQAMHPNASPPGDSALIDSGRAAHFDRAAYTQWLHKVREVCTERGIVFILDDIFLGFRLAPGGSQEYFGVRADMVTYGKTLGGGLPVGVLTGRRDLMKRYRDDRPGDICLARGTFNAHPQVMGAMNAFLRRFSAPQTQAIYKDLDATWTERANALNARFAAAGVPLALANMSTIWTVLYTRPSRYNWMFQYYLRKHGLALSWVGSGRLIFSLNYSAQDFAAVADQFVAAAEEMARDGWWWQDTNAAPMNIKRRVLREMWQLGILKRKAVTA
ncbi:MAG: aminotransferase class III-fold pyridoxal phosphate-dependent enzyme [Hyphomicrobium sp.]|nr:aminotransferase class III-fold pyridoxal phosphate-dependent enzyme [Hyphomicrobium sp.]